jgi:SAM-dependent methyltransferase
MEVLVGRSRRIMLQRRYAEGRIVNLGCGDDPCEFGTDPTRVTHVDIDQYNYPNFVRADLHKLPFRDGEYDTAVLGDVLEHVIDPALALREAGRVARRVVATVWEETRLPYQGLAKDEEGRLEQAWKMADAELTKMGYKSKEDYLIHGSPCKDLVVRIVLEEGHPHQYHINNFSDAGLKAVVKESGLTPLVVHKFLECIHEGQVFYNWLVILEGGNGCTLA